MTTVPVQQPLLPTNLLADVPPSPWPLYLYLLADPALDRAQYRALLPHCTQVLSLLPDMREEPRHAKASPQFMQPAHNVAGDSPPAWGKAVMRRRVPGAFTILCSTMPAAPLCGHLQRHLPVKLTQNLEMLLALWDPAILGTLVGQPDDDTLHIRGPVLTPAQANSLMQPIAAWWYCDRSGQWRCITATTAPSQAAPIQPPPFELSQQQEDDLVEASVPDQILYHLQLNRPTLFAPHVSPYNRYRFVRVTLQAARLLGLQGLRDLVNYTALCLIYRQRIQTDPHILSLLDKVHKQQLNLDQAIRLMPA